MDDDLTRDDMLLSAYRLSWPQPERRESPARRFARAVRRSLRPSRLEGWPVALSVPGQEPT
jgi:hypothetical protein